MIARALCRSAGGAVFTVSGSVSNRPTAWQRGQAAAARAAAGSKSSENMGQESKGKETVRTHAGRAASDHRSAALSGHRAGLPSLRMIWRMLDIIRYAISAFFALLALRVLIQVPSAVYKSGPLVIAAVVGALSWLAFPS